LKAPIRLTIAKEQMTSRLFNKKRTLAWSKLNSTNWVQRNLDSKQALL
jgi:hypothetical protein